MQPYDALRLGLVGFGLVDALLVQQRNQFLLKRPNAQCSCRIPTLLLLKQRVDATAQCIYAVLSNRQTVIDRPSANAFFELGER